MIFTVSSSKDAFTVNSSKLSNNFCSTGFKKLSIVIEIGLSPIVNDVISLKYINKLYIIIISSGSRSIVYELIIIIRGGMINSLHFKVFPKLQ